MIKIIFIIIKTFVELLLVQKRTIRLTWPEADFFSFLFFYYKEVCL